MSGGVTDVRPAVRVQAGAFLQVAEEQRLAVAAEAVQVEDPLRGWVVVDEGDDVAGQLEAVGEQVERAVVRDY
ncbi:hypothetical protein GCM10020001_034650 [Nonomuraea salmonea]